MIKIIRIILKSLRIFILTTLILIFTYLLFAVIFSILPTHPPKQSCSSEKNVFISSNGVHLDIIIPVNYLEEKFINELNILPGTKYVAFGWGDREFYIKTPEWSDLTLPVAFKALFLRSKTAMHVTCYKNHYDLWKKIDLCRWQIDSLNSYIENSFEKTKKEKLIKLSFPGYSNYDIFFNANGSFSIFKTCNVWTNNALKKIEMKTSVWSPFTFGVLYHVAVNE